MTKRQAKRADHHLACALSALRVASRGGPAGAAYRKVAAVHVSLAVKGRRGVVRGC